MTRTNQEVCTENFAPDDTHKSRSVTFIYFGHWHSPFVLQGKRPHGACLGIQGFVGYEPKTCCHGCARGHQGPWKAGWSSTRSTYQLWADTTWRWSSSGGEPVLVWEGQGWRLAQIFATSRTTRGISIQRAIRTGGWVGGSPRYETTGVNDASTECAAETRTRRTQGASAVPNYEGGWTGGCECRGGTAWWTSRANPAGNHPWASVIDPIQLDFDLIESSFFSIYLIEVIENCIN